jgi:hypothetical protein
LPSLSELQSIPSTISVRSPDRPAATALIIAREDHTRDSSTSVAAANNGTITIMDTSLDDQLKGSSLGKEGIAVIYTGVPSSLPPTTSVNHNMANEKPEHGIKLAKITQYERQPEHGSKCLEIAVDSEPCNLEMADPVSSPCIDSK